MCICFFFSRFFLVFEICCCCWRSCSFILRFFNRSWTNRTICSGKNVNFCCLSHEMNHFDHYTSPCSRCVHKVVTTMFFAQSCFRCVLPFCEMMNKIWNLLKQWFIFFFFNRTFSFRYFVPISISVVSLARLLGSNFIPNKHTNKPTIQSHSIRLEMHFHQTEIFFYKNKPQTWNALTQLSSMENITIEMLVVLFSFFFFFLVVFFFAFILFSFTMNSLTIWTKMHASCYNTQII